MRPAALALFVLLVACPAPRRPPPVVRARCPGAGSVAILGACLTPDEAAHFCGKGRRPVDGGCAPFPCPPEEPVDLATGVCTPARVLREKARALDVHVAEEDSLACEAGARLVVAGAQLACVPEEASCGRGAHWADGDCRPDGACPPGSVVDKAACIPVVRASDDHVLDVGAWARLVLGADGGEGAASLCAPLARSPGVFLLGGGSEATLKLKLEVVFPDNDVTRVHARVVALDGASGHPLSPAVAAQVETEEAPVWEALRALGGLSSAAEFAAEVRCLLRSSGPPRPHHAA